MTRFLYEQELAQMVERLNAMGGMVAEKITGTIEALRAGDAGKARAIAKGDSEVNEMEHDLERMCLNLIARQQPIARDLRTIASVLKIITDIERVADQCADICEIMESGVIPANNLRLNHTLQMLERAHGMFVRALDAFARRDVEEARRVCNDDDEVDSAFSRVVLEIANNMAENPQNVMGEVDLILIAKYVERMADHATNVAEWIIYMETGDHPDLNFAEEG